MKTSVLRRLALLWAVLLCGSLLALPAAAAEVDAPYAESGDMDYIRSYIVTVDPREDGTADITYDIDWQVIDGDEMCIRDSSYFAVSLLFALRVKRSLSTIYRSWVAVATSVTSS